MGREIRVRHDVVFVPKKWLGTGFFLLETLSRSPEPQNLLIRILEFRNSGNSNGIGLLGGGGGGGSEEGRH